MKNELWQTVHDVFARFDGFFGDFRTVSKAPEAVPSDAEPEGPEVDVDDEKPRSLNDLLEARTGLRSELDQVNARLAERLSERDAYLVLFPIVAHFDELVQTRFLTDDKLSWPPLQGELFQIDDAGELFFETLDDLLMKPQTLPFVFEVFYFCLSDGFKGRYSQNPKKINEYMDRLKSRIPVEDAIEARHRTEGRPQEVKVPGSAVPYYVAALIGTLLVYGVLVLSSWLWNPLSE